MKIMITSSTGFIVRATVVDYKLKIHGVPVMWRTNYFFEWTIWLGIAIFSLSAPHGWLALLAPALMLYLLLFVTGVRPSEEQALKSRGEAYRIYQSVTSSFIPWFPKPVKKLS